MDNPLFLMTDRSGQNDQPLRESVFTEAQNSNQKRQMRMNGTPSASIAKMSNNTPNHAQQDNRALDTQEMFDSDEHLDLMQKIVSVTQQKQNANGKHNSKTNHHTFPDKGGSTKRSQIYPDSLFLDSQQHHSQVSHKVNKLKMVYKVKLFAMNMLSLITKDKWEVFQSRKNFFNQVGDKASYFYNSFDVVEKQVPMNNKQITSPNKNKESQKNSGLPNFRQKQSIRILLHKPTNQESRKIMVFFRACLKKIPLISQQSIFRRIWDQIHLLCLLYYFTLIPVLISFNVPMDHIVKSTFVNYLFLFLLLLDIIWNFNTTFISQGQEISQRKIIIQTYIRNGFFMDLITFASLYIFLSLKELNSSYITSESYSFFLLAFYLRFKQFGRVLKKIEIQYYFSLKVSQGLRLIKLFLISIYIIHTIACFWIFIARIQDNLKLTWIGKYGLEDESMSVQFLNAFYFSTVTMVTVGYGDISPTTSTEKLFSVCAMLSGCGVFAYLINEVGSIFKKLNEEMEQKKDNMLIINGYMKKKKIPFELQCQIRHYLEYFWNESLSENSQKEQSIIDQLSITLKENLKREANRLFVTESNFFKNSFSQKTIHKIAQISREQRCHPEEVVYLQDDNDDFSIYFIEKGSVQCLYHPFSDSQNSKNKQSIVIKSSQHFGEVEFITGQKRMYQVRSLEFTTLIKINREQFLEIIYENDQDHQKYCMIRDDIILNQNCQTINQSCSYCSYCEDDLTWDQHHFEKDCPLFHFVPNKKKVILQILYYSLFIKIQEIKILIELYE